MHFLCLLYVCFVFGMTKRGIFAATQDQEGQQIKLEESVNQWDSMLRHRSRESSVPKPSFGTRAAVYRRSNKDWQQFKVSMVQPSDNLERVLVFGGYSDPPNSVRGSWVYTPLINSWYRLPLSSSEQPSDRTGHTMVSLCKTTVVLFGGYQDRQWYAFNDTWLFDGIREEWKKLEVKVNGEDVKPRAFHTGVVLQQERSSCQCKDSMFVFGGLHEYGNHTNVKDMKDVLELRCEIEVNGKRTYAWYRHRHSNESAWPKERHLHHAVAIDDGTMLVYGGVQGTTAVMTDLVSVPDAWLYDSKRRTWRRFLAYALHYGSIQYSSCALFDKRRNEALHLSGSDVYRLDLKSKKWIETSSISGNSTSSPERSMKGLSAVFTNSGIFAFSGVEQYADLLHANVWSLTFRNNTSIWQLKFVTESQSSC